MRALLLSIFLLFSPPQDITPLMGPASVEVDPLVALEVEEWLAENDPAGELTDIYAISGVSLTEGGEAVSLVGIAPATPDPYVWFLGYDSNVVWTGSVLISGGETALYVIPPNPETLRTAGPGGGTEVSFPWEQGKKMMFGPNGIHGEGEFGTSGMYAIDWVSGDDLGDEAAGPYVYASMGGAIDWYCTDTIQTAIRITNGDDVFLYAHLERDTGLTHGRSFSRGQYIGKLVYGEHTSPCGRIPDQQALHYHLHWMVNPENGRFMAESWILQFSDEKWHKGNEEVAVNMWMRGGGGFGGGDDPNDPNDPDDPDTPGPGTPGQVIRFWSYILGGVRAILDFLFSYWPTVPYSMEGDSLWDMATNVAATMLRDANVMLVNDVINLMPMVYLATAILAIEVVMWILGAILLALRMLGILLFK